MKGDNVQPSIVPELFFDLYARMIPGGVLLAGVALAWPSKHNAIIDALNKPKQLPPTYILATAAIITSYIVGIWLQNITEGLMARRWDTFENVRKHMTPVMGTVPSREPNKPFDERTWQRICAQTLYPFSVPIDKVNFHEWFDYVRTRTANGPIMVKCFGESNCMCSLFLAFIIIGLELLVLSFWHVGALLMAIAAFFASYLSYKAALGFRSNAVKRLFTSVLLKRSGDVS